MTSSAPQGSEKRGSKLAGRRFGLDLRKLFEDEEGTSVFEGFEPMMGTTTKEFQKGRSPSSLTYKAAPQPAREVTTGPVLARTAVIETPTAPAPEPEPIPEPEVPKTLAEMSGQEIFQNFSQYDQGEQGLFGGKDVDYLRQQGVADETIREVARLRSAGEQTPAAVYARLGGTLTSSQPASAGSAVNPQQYAADYLSGTTDVGAQGIFGGQDVDAMRAKGYTDEQIRATASAVRGAGQTIPAAVFRRLGNF